MSTKPKNRTGEKLGPSRPGGATPLLPASFPSGPAWYLAATMLHREQRAAHEADKLGFETFLPMERYRARVNSRKTVEKEKPLFPQYLFVRFDINADSWGLIRGVEQVRHLLGADNIPRAAPREFVDRLRSAEDIGLFDNTTAHLRMEAGEELEILEGPFAHHIATFIRAPSKKRVEVLLDLFKRPTRMSFDVDQVRRRG